MSLLLSGGCFSGLMEGCKGDRPACCSEVEQSAVVCVMCWILSHRLKNSCRRLLWNPSLCGLFTTWKETSGEPIKHFLFFFLNTVQRPGHRALPGHLPHRPHHAGHGGQRQAGCKFLSSRSSWSQPGSCSVFYNYQADVTHPVTPFAERLHQLWQKEKGECCNAHQSER